MGHLLSPSYTKPASPYRTVNATTLPASWSTIKLFTRVYSRIGPVQSSVALRIVKFVASVMTPVFGSAVSRVRPRAASTLRMIVLRVDGGCSN